jgi:hypothetical protein
MQEPSTEHGRNTLRGEAAEGGEPHGRRVPLRTDAELECPPGAVKRVVGVSHAESWRQNIYASKLAHYTFLQWNHCTIIDETSTPSAWSGILPRLEW